VQYHLKEEERRFRMKIIILPLVLPLLLMLSMPGYQTAYYYERESRTEIASDSVNTVTTTTTKVWIKNGFMRIEGPAVPGAQRQVVIYRNGAKFLLDENKKTAIRISDRPMRSSPASQGPVSLDNYEKLLVEHGASKIAAETANGEDCNVYTVPPSKIGVASPLSSHKVWISRQTHFPIKEIISDSRVTITITYKNISVSPEIPDTLFEIPGDFAVTEMQK
jgi:outer membrane lipoprotein-sorting protein